MNLSHRADDARLESSLFFDLVRRVVVAAGEVVRLGQLVGRAGNSGNTLEPHLHVEGRRGGEAPELLFGGRRLAVNGVVTG